MTEGAVERTFDNKGFYFGSVAWRISLTVKEVLGQSEGEETPRTISQCGVPGAGKYGLDNSLGAGLTVRGDRLGSSIKKAGRNFEHNCQVVNGGNTGQVPQHQR